MTPELAAVAAQRVSHCTIHPDATVEAAQAALDSAGLGIVLVCDSSGRLCGIITDGDLRKAYLAGVAPISPCASIINRHPVVMDYTVSEAVALEVMNHSKSFYLIHLPLIDHANRVAGLLLRSDLEPADPRIRALIMAGGFGTRLGILTSSTPKPMLEIGGKPLLEIIIDQVRSSGIGSAFVSTHFLAHKIVEHFGDGSAFGLRIDYIHEATPLGTGGAIGLLPPFEETLLVMNGDVLTGVDIRLMVQFHREHRADLTVGVRRYEVNVPYGVLQLNGTQVVKLEEKPTLTQFANAGVYLLEPQARSLVTAGQRFNMTDLISSLLAAGRKVVGFPIREYWLDIGHPGDYRKANQDFSAGDVTS